MPCEKSITALREEIQLWETLPEGKLYPDERPLCDIHWSNACWPCPISMANGEGGCVGMPSYAIANGDFRFTKEDQLEELNLILVEYETGALDQMLSNVK